MSRRVASRLTLSAAAAAFAKAIQAEPAISSWRSGGVSSGWIECKETEARCSFALCPANFNLVDWQTRPSRYVRQDRMSPSRARSLFPFCLYTNNINHDINMCIWSGAGNAVVLELIPRRTSTHQIPPLLLSQPTGRDEKNRARRRHIGERPRQSLMLF